MMVNVVKIGGNVIDNPVALERFLATFASLTGHKILIHGGGKIATRIAEQLNIPTVMVEGRRVTDAPMRDVVTMVYGGLVNKQIVAGLQALGCNAIGLTGADGNSIRSEKRKKGAVDYGFVGDVKEVNVPFIKTLLDAGVTPVFAPLTHDLEGQILNTNADTQASSVAVAIASAFSVNLIYCFEKRGVLKDASDDNSVIASLDPDSYERYRKEGVIYEGMIPKLDNAFAAVRSGVAQVIICHADELSEAVEQGKAGTRILI